MKIKYKIQVILTLLFPHIWGLIFETLQNHFILFEKIYFGWNAASEKKAENQHCEDWYLKYSKITSFYFLKLLSGEIQPVEKRLRINIVGIDIWNPPKQLQFSKKISFGWNLASEEKAENQHCLIDSKAFK